jgi:hypothetical protein
MSSLETVEKEILNKTGPLSLFSRHGLAGLVIGMQFILIGYTLYAVNNTMTELIATNRELKVLIQSLVR